MKLVNLRLMSATMVLVIVSMLTTGCWDRRELQERSFVLAVGIDLAANIKVKPIEQYVSGQADKPILLSTQLLKYKGGAKTDETGRGTIGATYVLEDVGGSIFETIRDMAGQNSKSLWFEHIQAIVISEDVLREYTMAQIIDFFRRDSEIRGRTKVFVTPGKAVQILNFQPPTGEPGGLFFANLTRNAIKDPNLPTMRVDLGYISQMLDDNSDFILPAINLADGKTKVSGMALFKRGQFVGYADEYAIKGAKLILGYEKSGVFTAPCPLHPNGKISFELFRHQTTLKPVVDGDNIFFELEIAMRGNLGEITCGQPHNTTDPVFIGLAKEAFRAEVIRNIEYSEQILKYYGVDNFRYVALLKAYHPQVWNKIKDRWDEIFPTIPLVKKIAISIQNPGEHK